ncbi:MAG: ATPase, T2SS/T4P/T4SS family [bacterium]|nr:ATPase, T2SS/T4P/T4SS family [bacterium]
MAVRSILDILVGSGAITLADASAIRREARQKNIPIEDELFVRGIHEADILKAKGEALGVEVKILGGNKVQFDLLKAIPEESAKRYNFVPVGLIDGVLEVGMTSPESIESNEALKFIVGRLGKPFKVFLISKADLDMVLGEYRGIGGEVTNVLGELESAIASDLKNAPTAHMPAEMPFVEDAPITKMVAVILRHATEGHASDVHIEPGRDNLRVRFRVDGVLYNSLILPLKVHEQIVSRIKVLTSMQLDEKRKPQDGRFSAKIDDRDIDFRVSTFPTYYGEKVAIRILDSEAGIANFEKLGVRGTNLSAIQEGLTRSYGLILITGPTGSGKSTTLYAMLQSLNKEGYNVVSLEDPVEYSIQGVNQSQVRPEIGYDFAQGLRHILRQDPDIIMVGEIRDKETAQLAIHAALTGHLVLSTLHTNNAVGVIPRLVDMGVDPYLIAPTLDIAIGQRLVRCLCEESKEEVPVEGKLKETLEAEIAGMPAEIRKNITLPAHIYRGKVSGSCPKGARGRIAVFEVLSMTKELEKIVLEKPNEGEVLKEAFRQGMINMHQDGILKVLDGTIGLEELMEVV